MVANGGYLFRKAVVRDVMIRYRSMTSFSALRPGSFADRAQTPCFGFRGTRSWPCAHCNRSLWQTDGLPHQIRRDHLSEDSASIGPGQMRQHVFAAVAP